MTLTREDRKRLKRPAGCGGVGVRACVAPEPLALPIPQAVAVTGLSRSALYRLAGEGRIVLLKHGRTTLVEMASARAVLAGLPRASIRAPRGRTAV
jgi:hypothetical protein